MDEHVGLGTWPEAVSGLLASATGNVDAIESNTNRVFRFPQHFKNFYYEFAKSWLVPPAQDFITPACGSPSKYAKYGIPTNVFYAKNLKSTVYSKARAICYAKGVRSPALLDECTVDVAVLGASAATPYTKLPTPNYWGKVTFP